MALDSKRMLRNLFAAPLRRSGHVNTSSASPAASSEPLLRAELFNAEQMARHGEALAGSHAVGSSSHIPDRLRARLAENEAALTGVRTHLTAAARENLQITPAGEWLLDNFYLIEEHIHIVRLHFPRSYSRGLPGLTRGPSRGLPRVYDIALEIISHGDGRVDARGLERFLAAYQSVTPLTLGELWAIPIMLRLALIENLRRIGMRVAATKHHRDLARYWAEQMAAIIEQDPKSLVLGLADMAESEPPMVGAFVAEFVRRLQGQSSALRLPLSWIEQSLAESGQSVAQLVQAENQEQAAEQVSISNSIGSLRFLEAMDWRGLVETLSHVEQVLRQDLDGVYGNMDFATRDRYRRVVEGLAKAAGRPELEVAKAALHMAHAAATGGEHERRTHVGFYLIDAGRRELEKALHVRRTVGEILRGLCRHAPLLLYAASIVLPSLVAAGAMLVMAWAGGLHAWLLIPVGLLALLCVSQLSLALVNWAATLLARPQLLPRMDYAHGIPPELRTLVAVPTLLTNAVAVEHLIEGLEVRYLGNRDANLYFSLLTDFPDAPTETTPADAPLLALAIRRIRELNARYPNAEGETFHLLHRPRRWNRVAKVWMGYERKRGKLADLNSVLRGGSTACFSVMSGELSALQSVKYVITLDTDTQLPRDSAHQLVGVMAHPLNRPICDGSRGCIRHGYGMVQPRVAISLTSINRTYYSRLFAGEPGIDPYTHAVSDVYQDLFAEGSFIGKGIYDVDAFAQVLQSRLPENLILSHDLLEGCYLRTGLLSDVLLYEDHPADYRADVLRRQRWIRGDWQISGWLTARVRGAGAGRQRNPLSALSRGKILDNLRRSLVPAALTILLLLGWGWLPAAWFWTVCVIGILFLPLLANSAAELLRKPNNALLNPHLMSAARSAIRATGQALFTLACLPFEAWFSLGASARAVTRMWVTHARLLEWSPISHAKQATRADLAAYYRLMWIAPALALAVCVWLAVLRPAALLPAWPILLLWLAAPALAWQLSRPRRRSQPALRAEQRIFLHKLARTTWAFFETFVGPEDNWLPPDSYQEYPSPILAHRTSPTNIGLALLANLAAYDFGYLSAGKLVERCGLTLENLQKLQRYKGHFYNWYDTQSLQTLQPLYVSSVDSGNLAGHLLTLRQGLLALADQRILNPEFFAGLRDTLEVLMDSPGAGRIAALDTFRATLDRTVAAPPADFSAAKTGLEELTGAAAVIAAESGADPEDSAHAWARALARQCREALEELQLFSPPAPGNSPQAIPSLKQLAQSGHAAARARGARIQELADAAAACADMDYDFLYDDARHLLAIGYDLTERKRSPSYYDLLASEARLSSFVAIAQGKLPQEHWFALGRLLAASGGAPLLMSWSGSMFEYLMPLLVMPSYPDTLLDQAHTMAVQAQIEYGALRQVPWGISESGYNVLNAHFNYQYRAFGVPSLGLKRGLTGDLVIAPYASALALMVAPVAACLNLQHMERAGFAGRYGFHEAIDYTPARVPRSESHAVVRSYMAHHQGMSLLALAYLLRDRPMQKRFLADPAFQATTLLLQERVPKATVHYSHGSELADLHVRPGNTEAPMRIFTTPHTPIPEVQLLSNGRYHVMTSNAGGGYSRWNGSAVTRWREDGARDHWGTFCYLRDAESGALWSTAYQPTLQTADKYEAVLGEGRTEYRVSRDGLDAHTVIAVSPEDDIELRQVTVTNHSRTRRTVDIVSYTEVVLAPLGADDAHPAFSNMFVETEILRARQAIVCSRRPRSAGEQPPWMLHLVVANLPATQAVSYETDRARFVGRGHTPANPQALESGAPLSGTEGAVLDPVAAIRYRVELAPDAHVTLNFVTGVAETREQCLSLVNKYQDRNLAHRVLDLAYTHSQVILRQLNASAADAQLYGHLAGSVIYANPSLRTRPDIMRSNHRGQSGLWGYAISGDLPIVLLRISDQTNIDLVRQLVQAHAYWRLKGLAVDLVIWNEDHAGYRQQLHDQIMGLISTGAEAGAIDRAGGIFVKIAEQIAAEDRVLLQSIARVVISDGAGTLAAQVNRAAPPERTIPQLARARPTRPATISTPANEPRELLLANGVGGFTPDGREYVITLEDGETTPAPWVNVLANPEFGTLVSESGVATTWSENSHEFRLTPWSNDPVSDPAGEAFYIRDEETGRVWSPSPLPCRGSGVYVTRHGFGYSVFEHVQDDIRSELWIYVAHDAPVKFAVCKLRNLSERARKLSVTGYVEWVLADLRPKSLMHVITELDRTSGALLARNPYNQDFGGRVAFFDVDDPARSVSGDRGEFLGRNGSPADPAALRRVHLSGKTGAGLDPCGALQVRVELADDGEYQVVFRLGVGHDTEHAKKLVDKYRGTGAAEATLVATREHWQQRLSAVQIDTPDPALNILANGWLLYQVIACRLWARTAFYQPSGAFGFRDQLQDVMALMHTAPELLRAQLLLAASRQFPEGDVQHWWQTPTGRGIRSACSDDYLWLPLVACRYVQGTGDTAALDETIPFIQGRPLNPGEDSYYDLPSVAHERATLYEHCTRAIVHGLRFGAHGLPLMGTGDWNDGMNKVGERGSGESVWLGFFLHVILTEFGKLAELRGDHDFATRCAREAGQLHTQLEAHAWDGSWYRRAWFDDGTALGSRTNTECQIDSIAQSWAVLSGVAPPERARLAMQAVDQRLVDREHRLVLLLAPPFDKCEPDPGYIKGYPPGIRENGGQYTHASAWAAMAYARLGDRQRTWELLQMLNPLNHSANAEALARYRVEPYVMASDVYALDPHAGHGGWTWYTGSAGWMYQLIVESFLGLKRRADKLLVEPCLPAAWRHCEVHYRFLETPYRIHVVQTAAAQGGVTVVCDDVLQPGPVIPLTDDHQQHNVEVKVTHEEN